MAVLPGRGVREISEIILANCESLVSRIRGLRVYHACLWSVWRCSEQETQHATRLKALVDIYAPTGCQKGSVRLDRGGKAFWDRVSFWRQEAYLFRHFLSEVSRKIVIFVFILFRVYFIFYVIFFKFLIQLSHEHHFFLKRNWELHASFLYTFFYIALAKLSGGY